MGYVPVLRCCPGIRIEDQSCAVGRHWALTFGLTLKVLVFRDVLEWLRDVYIEM